MLPLGLSPLLLLLLPVVPCNGFRKAKLSPRLELSQFLQNVSWQHDPRLSKALRQSVLDIMERRPGPDLFRRQRAPFRPVGDLQIFRSFSPRGHLQRPGMVRRGPAGGSARQAANRPKMKFEKGKPHIYEKRSEKSVDLFCSVAYQAQVSIFWTLNGKPLEDYDSLSEETVPEGRISSLSINTLTRLPTRTGVYTFNCTTLTDYDLATVHLDVSLPLSDECGGQHNTDCAERIAVCRDKSCVCEGYYKVKLNSVHVTCRNEAFLETPCMYDEQCLSTSNHSECTSRGWCACLKGYGRTEEQKCVPKVGARSRCNSEDECADYDATCILNHCTCFSHKKEFGDRCINIAEHMKSRSVTPSVRWVTLWGLVLLAAMFHAGVCA
ncbi:uncharacterized protein ISCGN_000278 [Ixodes scapularis]